ncbi:hypothetical protein AB0K02_27805 [Streptomyces sp. NPDC049597]
MHVESAPAEATLARAYPGPTGIRLTDLWKRYDPDGVLRPRPPA